MDHTTSELKRRVGELEEKLEDFMQAEQGRNDRFADKLSEVKGSVDQMIGASKNSKHWMIALGVMLTAAQVLAALIHHG